jgi:chemotaxis protein histidine kinase CheA
MRSPELSMPNLPADVQIHNPPNRLKAKLGNLSSVFDAKAIARAEAAVAAISSNFGQWLSEEIAKLDTAYLATTVAGSGEEELGEFYRRAHDLKGLGTTYGFPIISEFAASLCHLLDSPEARARVPRKVLEGHVNAIAAAVKQNITNVDHPVGQALLQELRDQVRKIEDAAS